MNSARLLEHFPLVRTQSAEEMCAALARVYAKPRLILDGQTKSVDVTVNRYQASGLAIAYTKHGTGITALYPDNNFALQAFPVRGEGEITINKIAYPLTPRQSVTTSPRTSFAIRFSPNYEHVVLVIDECVLSEKLSALTGVAINSPLSFHPAPDNRYAAVKVLRDHFFFLVDKLSTSAESLPKFVFAEFEQTFLVMFLHANQHNYYHLLQQTPPDPAPWQVRRAETYIEANWQQAMSLEDLAEVSGVSAFSLFRSFKKIRGYSPAAFLNRVRLAHARERLERPDAVTTVTSVASTCGFGDLGRFENDYVLAFGEHPSQTLSRGAGVGAAGH